MNFDELILSITPEIYERLKRAVELGKWDNGQALVSKQREHILQAIIAYDQKHNEPQERVGYIAPKPHSECGEKDDEDWDVVKIPDS